MIAIRVAKLKFLLDEMNIAFHLATHAPDSFSARTLARHILVRAENFIEHARGIKKPLNIQKYDTRNFHKTKEAYAETFMEYFKVSRDRLGAHVQDFDFGKRIELWNDIEIVKIGYFVDGAREIYQSLAAMMLPGYSQFADPPELSDLALQNDLLAFQRATVSGNWVELGSDSLAMTRENTTTGLNFTPVHARAAQLALIRRWIQMQRSLCAKLAAHSRIARMLKARIVTDIVSFCDCLVTRHVPAGAPQEMDGLDKLISDSGQLPAAITNFVTASNFHVELQVARNIRDKIGAHLEIDDSFPVSSLIADLDGYDLERGMEFYELVERAFIKTCLGIIYLRMYAADGQRIYGVATAGGIASTPYSGHMPTAPKMPPPMPPLNDEAAYHQYFRQWVDGDDTQREDARQFFWQAFGSSESIEQLDEVESIGGGYRNSRNELRKAHHFLSSMLINGLSDSDFDGVLKLGLSCANGWPYPLAEVLVRYGRTTSERQRQICGALGEIASAPHASVIQFLEGHRKSKNWSLRFQATIALFKIFVRSEGLFRVNNKGRQIVDYDVYVDSLSASMNKPERLLCSIAFASILSGPRIGSLSQPFAANYAALQKSIEMLCIPYLQDDAGLSKATTLKQLIQTNDYAGVCVMLGMNLQREEEKQLREALLDACCHGEIVIAAHDQASRHLAMCFLLKKDFVTALEIANGIAVRNPDWVEAQILVAQIMAETVGLEHEALRKIAGLRRTYKLDAINEATLAAADQELAQRKLPKTITSRTLN